MAFPSIAATGTTAGAAAANKVCNLPAGIASGNLLLLYLRSNAGSTHTTPTGWTELLLNDASDASNDVTSIWYRQADGAEGASVTVTTSASDKFTSLSWRITGHENPATRTPEVALATGTTGAPDPPIQTPTGGAKDYLWIAIAGQEGVSTVSAYPTNYTLNQITVASSGGGAATNSRSAGAARQLNAVSENPGTFTFSGSEDWTGLTLAVHPAPAGTTFFLTLAAAAIGVAVLSRIATFPKTMAAVAVGVATMTRVATFLKTLVATAVGVATLARKQFVTMAATAIGVASLTLASVIGLTLAAVAVGVATLSKIPTFVKTLATTAIGVATMTRVATYARTLAATAVGVATLARKQFQTMAATATGVATMTDVLTLKQALAALAVGVATLTKQFIAGGTVWRWAHRWWIWR